MIYCVNCTRYDYCSARNMCIDPPFGYCTRYQPKSVDGATHKRVGKALKALEVSE